MNILRQLLLVIVMMGTAAFAYAGGDNTIMLEGKPYTLHRVKSGETLYSIATAAGIDLGELKKVNRMDAPNAAVKTDDLVIIPVYSKTAANTKTPAQAKEKEAPKPTVKEATPKATGSTTHTVKAGEGLFAIARQHGSSVAAIKAANNLTTDALKEGQVLTIPSSDKKAPAEKTPAPVVATKTTATTTTPASKATPAVATKTPTAPTPVTKTPAPANEEVDSKLDLKMMNQLKATFESESKGKGTVEAIRGAGSTMQESGDGQIKFYALHKTAPVGKVLKVRNIMNNRITYVKVIGKLPDNSDNQNVMVKVSGAAAKYLQVLDAKFQCEVTEFK